MKTESEREKPCSRDIKTTQNGFISIQFSCSVLSDSLQSHKPQHTRPPCPSPTPGVHPSPVLSQWWVKISLKQNATMVLPNKANTNKKLKNILSSTRLPKIHEVLHAIKSYQECKVEEKYVKRRKVKHYLSRNNTVDKLIKHGHL